MREKLNETVINEAAGNVKPVQDDDVKVEAEDDNKQKKCVEPEKPTSAANRPADSSKKGLAPESPETAKGKKVGLSEAKKKAKK